jgi:prevent-host-death family protein
MEDATRMREIGAFEAKTRLGQLLDWVEAGEEIVITRRGKVVARLTQPVPAARTIRKMRTGVTLGGVPIKALIDEGRP